MTLDADLALAALRMALADRRPAPGSCITLYACGEYRKLLATHGIVASMSNQGDCWDNAVAESLFATLETELILEAAHAGRRAPGDLRVHRDVVQPAAAALESRLLQPGAVRVLRARAR